MNHIELSRLDMFIGRNLERELELNGLQKLGGVCVCVLGHRDPDIMELARSAPTPQTSSIYTFL